MKTTKNVLNVGAFRDALESLSTSEKNKLETIMFSTCGYEALKDVQIGNVQRLSKCEGGDVLGFLGGDPQCPTFFVTGKTPETKIKAPANISNMFIQYGYLGVSDFIGVKKIDVSGLDTRNTKDFSYCFANVGCNNPNGVKITGLDQWNTSNAMCMQRMFLNHNMNAKHTELDLSGFDVSKAVQFDGMFKCVAAKGKELEIKGIENWIFSPNAAECFMGEMFKDCGKLANFVLDLSKWKPGWAFIESEGRYYRPKNFASGTFLKIREPYPGK